MSSKRRGRKPSGAGLVARLDGSERAKKRLQCFLETISGKMSVPDACRELGIGEAMFHRARSQWLEDSLACLEPRPMGRPPLDEDPASEDAAALKKQIVELRLHLRAAQIREKIAVVMPHLFKDKKKPQ